MEWALGTLCLVWTLREAASLLAAARRQSRFVAWTSWEPVPRETRAAIEVSASPRGDLRG
jgi:hypothetical protein